MKKFLNPDIKMWSELLSRPVFSNDEIIPSVQEIITAVQNNGDKALNALSKKFDGAAADNILVSDKEFNVALENIDNDLKAAIGQAASNIEKFHSDQLPKTIRTETMPGVNCWQKSVPIHKVGLYIPGGSAPLFSTVLMLAIPARIARCSEVILCTPPDKEGKINPAILYAAKLTGVNAVFKVGGAQAVAAMAYGTETVPKMNKIFGPGNQYVTTAKQLISAQGIAIDMPAGPSEVMVVVDEKTPAEFAAADLLSQAEHGADSQVILLSDSSEKLDEIKKETYAQLEQLTRRNIAEKALQNSRLVYFSDKAQLLAFMNAYAPEHLILSTENADELAQLVTQAGSVFIGNYTPESAGDYASGTNHTLPTNGFASAYSGINMDSFMKKISFQKITKDGLLSLGPTIETMAKAEWLDAHKNAVSIRLKAIKNS